MAAGDSEENESRQPDKPKRGRHPKGQSIHANLGGTAYTEAPAYSLIEFNVAYFHSGEFQQFQADIQAEAAQRGVRVVAFHEAMGIWQNDPASAVELEPSASVELVGHEDDVVALAKAIGSRYKQFAMLLIIPDPNAHQSLYSIEAITQDEIGAAIATMRTLEVNGGRYVNENLEIADKNNRWRDSVIALARRLHKPVTQIRAKIILLEGDEPGKAEGKDYEWIGPR